MNKPRKIILTLWTISWFSYWLISSSKSSCTNDNAILGNCVFENLVFTPMFLMVIFGMPALVLYLIWGDKKKK